MFPKLRFKKFDGDWEKTTIGAKSEIVTSGSRDWAQYYSDSGDKFIRMTNLVRNGINLDLSDLRFVQLPVGSNEGKRTSLEKGDILISITAELGKLGWIPEGLGTAYINQHTALVRMKNTLDSKFVAYALSTEKYNNKLNSLNDSGAKAGLNLGTIRSFELTIPSKPEQTQIASFLSVVDEKISQLTQKLELLSQYKQGMMQKLFSQQIRFKADDGSEFGEWEDKKLGEVGENIIGLTYSPTDVTNDGTGILVLRSSNIKEGRLDKSDKVRVNKKIQDKIIVQPNDILICTRNGSQRLIGKSVIINDDEVMTFGAFMSVYRSKYNRFIAYLMQTPWFFEQVQMNLGARINQITTGTLNEFTFDFPCLEEQTKIANFLSAIDQKIEVVAQQIEQAKQWKKGLLQQMFV